jgi:phage N-6-adenine-methyltransferase
MKNRNLNHKDDWSTPPEFYNKLNEEFNFDFDPCPYQHDINEWDGLKIEWGKRNYINPPYSRKLKEGFILKAVEESKKGKLCVMLIPVSTSTAIFHDHILPNVTDIRFVRGRLKFGGHNTFGEYVTNKPGMHDSMIVIFDGRNKLDVLDRQLRHLYRY